MTPEIFRSINRLYKWLHLPPGLGIRCHYWSGLNYISPARRGLPRCGAVAFDRQGHAAFIFLLIYIIRGTWVVTLSGTHIGEMEATLTTSTITRQAPVIFWSHGWMIALTHILAKYSTIYIILLVIYNYYIVYIHCLNLCAFYTITFWFRRILAYNQSLWNILGEFGD